MKTTARFLAFSGSAMLAATQAFAAPILLDFTDSAWLGAEGQTSYTRSIGSLDVTLSASGAMTFNQDDAPGGGAPLSLHGDGLGIRNDEISWLGNQWIDVSFSSSVTVLGYYFLDFFGNEGPGGSGELARAVFDGITTLLDEGTADGIVGYYAREGISIEATSVLFAAGTLGDHYGLLNAFSDFALAGLLIDVGASARAVAVPEPGTLGLLGAGLLGFGWVRRSRHKGQ
jgi:hypothetical protein